MQPDKKIKFLAGAAVILLAVYLLTLFFDPERVAARNASFTWLPAEGRDLADRVEISNPGAEKITLERISNKWYAHTEAGELPVKQGRVDDVFRILSEKGAFPKVGSSASGHADTGLLAGQASQIVIRGGGGVAPLLDLLVGSDESGGKGVFLRKNGENEYRLGDSLIKTYLSGGLAAWYDLKLFAENKADSVQRVTVSPVKDGEGDADYTLAKSGNDWSFSGGTGTANGDKVNAWLRNVFDAQADDFGAASPEFGALSIRLEMGDGSAYTVQAAEESGSKWPVKVSGAPYTYLLSENALKRLFSKKADLE
jgi:hypothetical protein